MLFRFPATGRARFGIVVLLGCLRLAADTLAWVQMQRVLAHRVARLTQSAASAGWRLTAAPGERGGWPWAATLSTPMARLEESLPSLPAGMSWSGERIVLSLSMSHPRRVTIRARGTQMISFTEAGMARRVRFWGAQTTLYLPSWTSRGTGSVRMARVDAQALHVALPGAGPDDVLTVARLGGVLRWTPQARALTLDLDAIALPREPDAAFSEVIPHATLDASVARQDDRLLLRQAALRWKDASMTLAGAATWQSAGGHDFAPSGAFSVRITGADALLARATRTGTLTPAAAVAVRAVLGLIAAAGAQDATGTLPALELPLTLRAGLLMLGRIPLLRIP